MLDKMRRRTPPLDQAALAGHTEQILMLLNRIEAALVVRDPGNARSAEAYDGLRKQVIAGANERRRMLVMLTQLNGALGAGASSADVHSLVQEWMGQAGLQPISAPVTPEFFDITGAGTDLKVLSPAWVDASSGMVVTRGTAEAHPREPATPEPALAAPANAVEIPTTATHTQHDDTAVEATDEGARQ